MDNTDDEQYAGKVLLQGFDDTEVGMVRKILDKFEKKLSRFGYEEIRLSLNRHKKGGANGVSYLNEIEGLVKLKERLLHAEITSHEFYPAITRVMEKLEQEAEHALKLEQRHKGRIDRNIIDKTNSFKRIRIK